MKIVIEMMGGDLSHKATVPAVLKFAQEYPDVLLYVVGRKEDLVSLKEVATIIDAREVISPEAGALEALRAKESSLFKAISTVVTEDADAIVSAGSTGAYLSAATVKIKLIPGIERAAILSPFPTQTKGKFVAILDIGANNENTPQHLYQFAQMGRAYAQSVFGLTEPNTYLLSNGTEEGKGSPLTKQAYKLLVDNAFPNFKGNIEAREVLFGEADVVVADGFTGNVLLKSVEGCAKVLMDSLKKGFKMNIFTKIGYLFAKKGIKEMRETFDYKNTGGAILVGLNKVVVKAHGNSDPKGFYSALKVAYKMAEHDIVGSLKKGLVNGDN